jgi:copper chaperone
MYLKQLASCKLNNETTAKGEVIMTTKTYHVPNISCHHCTATIERELKALAGVDTVKADLDSKQVTVNVKDEQVLPSVETALVEIGYPFE